MSLKSKALAGVAALGVIAGGLGVAATAHASTPSCGDACSSIYNKSIGYKFVLDSIGKGDRAGNKVILFQRTNYDPAEDFTVNDQGTVSDLYDLGMVSAGLKFHFGGFEAVEIQYTPYGAGNGNCLGVAATAHAGSAVTLQPCGVTAKTLWVEVPTSRGMVLINGSDINFSHPYVLTYPAFRFPTDQPRPGLTTQPLSVLFGNNIAAVSGNQLWGGVPNYNS